MRATELRPLLLGPGVTVSATSTEVGVLEVRGLSSDEIGDRAAAAGIALHELTPIRASLEEAFMDLTHESVEFRATVPGETDHGDSDATPVDRVTV